MWKAMRRSARTSAVIKLPDSLRHNGLARCASRPPGVHHPPRSEQRHAPRISSTATSPPPIRTLPGSPTSPTCRRGPGWHACSIIDVFSRTIVGWRVAGNMRTDMVLGAVDMACFHGARHSTLVFHSDAGSQFTSIRYTERLAEIGASPSIGTIADKLRQRARRDRQRALQDRADPPAITMADRR